jgi:mono/diheme cytochrome c family protein
MRFAPRLFWVGMLGAALAWALRRLMHPRPQPTAAGPQAPEDEPLINRPDAPHGARTVIALGALSAAAVVAGLTWYAIDQHAENQAVALALTHGVADRAPALLTRYGCGGCHTISGAPGADGKVGPDLSGLRERVYVGGVLRNTPDSLVQWIVDPQRFSPRSAMPATGITEAEARDVAAYLYTH